MDINYTTLIVMVITCAVTLIAHALHFKSNAVLKTKITKIEQDVGNILQSGGSIVQTIDPKTTTAVNESNTVYKNVVQNLNNNSNPLG